MPVDYAGYTQQQRNINADYGAKQATNAYARTISQQRGARSVGDLTKNFSLAYPKFAASWGQRGQTGPHVQSGFYQQAMQNYLGDYQQNQNNLLQDLSTQDNQYALTQTQIEAEKQRAMADLELQKQQQIANLAASITSLRTV